MVTPFNFAPLTKTAIDQLTRFGRPMALLRNTEASPNDPTKPWRVGDGTVTTVNFTGVYTPLPFPRGDPIVDSTECDVIVPGNISVEPIDTDRIQIFGVIKGETDPVLAIVGIVRVDPAGTPIIFKLRCRAWPFITQPDPIGQ